MTSEEKQRTAKQLYQQYFCFRFSEGRFTRSYSRKPLDYTFHLCCVNDDKFILTSDIHMLTEYVRKAITDGIVDRGDVMVGKKIGGDRYFNGRPCTLLRLSAFKVIKENFLKVKYAERTECESIIEQADIFVTPAENTISMEQIKKMWEMYDTRNRLITESTRERKEEERETSRHSCGRIYGLEQKDDVADLVDRLEALGWQVTLTRKEQ